MIGHKVLQNINRVRLVAIYSLPIRSAFISHQFLKTPHISGNYFSTSCLQIMSSSFTKIATPVRYLLVDFFTLGTRGISLSNCSISSNAIRVAFFSDFLSTRDSIFPKTPAAFPLSLGLTLRGDYTLGGLALTGVLCIGYISTTGWLMGSRVAKAVNASRKYGFEALISV